jgi:hypothetical protein
MEHEGSSPPEPSQTHNLSLSCVSISLSHAHKGLRRSPSARDYPIRMLYAFLVSHISNGHVPRQHKAPTLTEGQRRALTLDSDVITSDKQAYLYFDFSVTTPVWRLWRWRRTATLATLEFISSSAMSTPPPPNLRSAFLPNAGQQSITENG